MSKKNYLVTIPITGHVDITCALEGEPSDDALLSAGIDQWELMSTKQQRDCLTWEFTNAVTEGNVCHAETSDMSWDETDEKPEFARKPSKAKLWRRVARLCGEAMIFSPYPVCSLSPKNERALYFARRLAAMSTRKGLSTQYSKLLRKIASALAAWEAAE